MESDIKELKNKLKKSKIKKSERKEWEDLIDVIIDKAPTTFKDAHPWGRLGDWGMP